MTVRAVPRVTDPYGYFVAYNRRLVEAMVRRPVVAKITRAILEGIDRWAAERGLAPEAVEPDIRLVRSGRIVVVLRTGDDPVQPRWEGRVMAPTADGASLVAVGTTVIVKVWEAEAESRGGIFLPETAREKPQVGTVVSVGDRVRTAVAPGDVVLFPRYAGSEITIGDQEYLVLAEDDLLARWVRTDSGGGTS